MRIAVIPARGGSKRIPRKNIKNFCGKPIITYSIEAALSSSVIDRVIVSTDNQEVGRIARECGAETPFTRPADLSDDMTPMVPVVQHAATWIESNWGPVNMICCIHATAPFIRAEDLRSALHKYMDEGVTGYVFSASRFGFPVQRGFRLTQTGHCEMLHPEFYNTRSQDIEEVYQDAGQFYWGSSVTFRSGRAFFSLDSKPYVLPRYRVQDIDTDDDWLRAENMWRVLHDSSSSSLL